MPAKKKSTRGPFNQSDIKDAFTSGYINGQPISGLSSDRRYTRFQKLSRKHAMSKIHERLVKMAKIAASDARRPNESTSPSIFAEVLFKQLAFNQAREVEAEKRKIMHMARPPKKRQTVRPATKTFSDSDESGTQDE